VLPPLAPILPLLPVGGTNGAFKVAGVNPPMKEPLPSPPPKLRVLVKTASRPPVASPMPEPVCPGNLPVIWSRVA
jgi:hypothetical protein